MINSFKILVLIFMPILFLTQDKDVITSDINSYCDDLRSIKTKYYDLITSNKYLIYDKNKDGNKSYYSKTKYDSLLRTGIPIQLY